MDQPLFSCTRCLKSFPHSQMARSGTSCKLCAPHHSSFKQCDYCKSDFKHSVSGPICPRCQSLKTKYGEPHQCSICILPVAYGNALVCQRCLHYRNKFGDPKQCQKCLQMCAFYKDEASRSKVDGQVLCWVCTYNFKMSKSKERSDNTRPKHSYNESFFSKASLDSSSLAAVKRQRTEDYTLNHAVARPTSTNTYSMDSAYNEHILTIGQLQDEVKQLKRQLLQKDAELLGRDRRIGELRSELSDLEAAQREKVLKAQHLSDEEIHRLKETIRSLQREKSELAYRAKKRKSNAVGASMTTGGYYGSPLTLSPMRIPPKIPSVPKLISSISTPTLFRRGGDIEGIMNSDLVGGTPSQDSVASSPIPTPEPDEVVNEYGDSENHESTSIHRPRKLYDVDRDLNVQHPEDKGKAESVSPESSVEPVHDEHVSSPSLSSSSSINLNIKEDDYSLKDVEEDDLSSREETTPTLIGD